MNVRSVSECSCLNEKNILLYYPYFANTFLLNYSIKCDGLLGGKATSEIIKWDKEALIDTLKKEKESKNDILIFFATERMLEDVFFSSFNIEKFDFSLYLPRFVFIPFSIEAYRLCYADKNFENYSLLIDGFKEDLSKIPSFSDSKLQTYLKRFKLSSTIYSDTPNEANSLNDIIRASNIFCNEVDKPEMKLLYYGAPYSIYLLNEYPEFLPIRIDSLNLTDENNIKKSFETKNIIYCKSKISCELRDKCIVKEKIEDFHKNIFEKAKENPKTLADIYYMFVQENKEQIPYHIFKNVECFTKAITYHHKYLRQEIDPKINIFTSNLKELTSEDNTQDNIEYSKSHNSFKENAFSYFILLVYHYIINKEDIKELIFKEITLSLKDKTFLNGRYYYLFQNIVKTLYVIFFNELKKFSNPLYRFSSKYKLDESRIIYSQFRAEVINEVNNRTKDIESISAFNNLIKALKYDIKTDNISTLSSIILESEIEHTLLEIVDIKNEIFEKYEKSSMFRVQEKRNIKVIKNEREKKDKIANVYSIVKPDTSKITS